MDKNKDFLLFGMFLYQTETKFLLDFWLLDFWYCFVFVFLGVHRCNTFSFWFTTCGAKEIRAYVCVKESLLYWWIRKNTCETAQQFSIVLFIENQWSDSLLFFFSKELTKDIIYMWECVWYSFFCYTEIDKKQKKEIAISYFLYLPLKSIDIRSNSAKEKERAGDDQIDDRNGVEGEGCGLLYIYQIVNTSSLFFILVYMWPGVSFEGIGVQLL